MEIIKKVNGDAMELTLAGRLDTNTAPQLEATLKESLDKLTSLTLDFKDLEYVSSAGLRVLLSAQKAMNKQGDMIIKNVCADIMDVFNITGFVDILRIE